MNERAVKADIKPEAFVRLFVRYCLKKMLDRRS